MANGEDPDQEKREMRAMMIFAVAGVLFILGLMGANMLLHPEKVWAPTDEMSSQSRGAPSQ
ncbi:MAG TPA: hypothetical protein VKE26_17355 [Xanthobacteraceae bacterium]|jgi:hypothetical protein|nr:hypothetical protein [Xanthobacteraceae bacterium]